MIVTFSEHDLASVVGRRFPGGTYTITPWRAWLTNDVVLAPKGGEHAHPVLVFIAATSAMGISWDGLFDWFGASADDGPMFGDCDIEINRPLLVGGEYRIDGFISGAERKHGRRAGVFDLVRYQLELRDRAGDEPAAVCRNSIVLPRRAS